jgi:hypothetical protein
VVFAPWRRCIETSLFARRWANTMDRQFVRMLFPLWPAILPSGRSHSTEPHPEGCQARGPVLTIGVCNRPMFLKRPEQLPRYFDKGCLRSQIRGAKLNSSYRAEWFDPRNGTWRDAGNGTVRSSVIGIMMLPDFPGEHRLGTSPDLYWSGAAGSGRSPWQLSGTARNSPAGRGQRPRGIPVLKTSADRAYISGSHR